ncbi:MAG TPA: flavin-dependent oxidoreductase [Mycobacteriales bacterium]|nr:flavin-dependent oxidoreductase [Mycobacteriales bacterium]
MRVVIVGAGIGGLTTALELHRVGIDCQLYEAVDQISPVGVGVNVLPHAARILGDLGLADELAAVSVLTRESVFYNRFGQLVYAEPAGRFAGHADPQYSIHRADLQDVLLRAVRERLGPDAVRLGRPAVRVSQDDRRATVHFADHADPAGADAVIGADGIHSVVRAQFHPHEGPPRYSGITMWRGVSVWPRFLSGASMLRAGWFPTGKLVAYPIRHDVDGRGNDLVNWIAEKDAPASADRRWDRRGHLADVIDCFTGWSWDWLDVPGLLRAAPEVLEYPMVDQDPLDRWGTGRVTLLGDAAHPMLPRGSNGAGQAILDARALASSLAACRAGEGPAALARYEDLRREATSAVVRANRVSPPDAILGEVYRRTGDRPFRAVTDVVSLDELRRLAHDYRRVTGDRRTSPAG